MRKNKVFLALLAAALLAFVLGLSGCIRGDEEPPPQPPEVTATGISTSEIQITWNAVPGAIFRIEVSTDGTSGWNTFSGLAGTSTWSSSSWEVSATSFTHTELSPETTRWYRVIVIDRNGRQSSPSAVVSATTQAVGVLTGVTATGISANEIRITWNAVPEVTHYRIEVSTDGTSGWTTFSGFAGTSTSSSSSGNVSATSFTHAWLPANTTMWYRVFALDSNGRIQSQSAVVSATTGPRTPTNVTASTISASEIRITWNAVPEATHYRIEFATISTNQNLQSNWSTVPGGANVTGISFIHSGLPMSTQRWYRVIAVNPNGESFPSFTTSNQNQASPATARTWRVTAAAQSTSMVRITWGNGAPSPEGNIPGVASFRVARANAANGPWEDIAFLAGTAPRSVDDTGMSPNTRRYYRVTKVDSADVLHVIAIVPATTYTDTPTGVTATALSTSAIQISWNAQPATSFRVEFTVSAPVTGTAWAVVPGGEAVTGTSITHSGLSPNTTRWYRVISVNSAGRTSDPSAHVSATTNQ